MKLHFEDFDLQQLLAEVVAMMKVPAEAKGVALNLMVVGGKREFNVRSDSRRIKQIVINLVSNAIKFCPPKDGRIVVEAEWKRYRGCC